MSFRIINLKEAIREVNQYGSSKDIVNVFDCIVKTAFAAAKKHKSDPVINKMIEIVYGKIDMMNKKGYIDDEKTRLYKELFVPYIVK